MRKPNEIISEALILAAAAVGDVLTEAGFDSERFGFTLVLWPIGEPEHCSSICGSGHLKGQSESSAALGAASEKAKREPITITRHQRHRPN